ncbi:fumarylacetoacetase [Sediminitomix flava]|uniref:fumarylacetoacetase n=1 Tax=Sediminitomix flava TaxID=379075 RepID=A0A315Z5M4_SEDFL|nr:fumarylacetoacetase [Sediminitomix flava]PWJ39203.1 fumarylacetoacetate hydrolase [Sediminitomix flava]
MKTTTQKLQDSWVHVPENSDFPIQNLPYGIFQTEKRGASVGVAIGEQILVLEEVARLGFFDDLNIDTSVFSSSSLNNFISLGKKNWTAVRQKLTELLDSENDALQSFKTDVLVEMADAEMLLPVEIGDYTDFYSSIEHATNVGTMFRGADNALMPNWKHLPVGYHGRASSIVVSGTDIHRPKGQTLAAEADTPEFGPSKRMDFELEMAFIIGKNTELGETVSTENAEDHIFGMVVFNDWSARDIQKWEYVPLGPFLGKNFASSISPWIVTMDALEPFRVESPTQDPKPLPYLQYEGNKSYDINLSVAIAPENSEETVVCNSNFKYMYWTMAQQLTHHTVNGCNIRVGDMMASGTLSGSTPDSFASMLELSWAGQKEVPLSNGETRKFLRDGDTVVMSAHCQKGDLRVGFGEVRSKLLPSR